MVTFVFPSVFCKYLIAIVAAILGAFTDSNDVPPANPCSIVTLNGSITYPEALPYPICNQFSAGLSPIDLCVMSSLAYSTNTAAETDAKAWFGAAGARVDLLQFQSSNLGLQVSAYSISNSTSGGDPFEENSTIVIVTRGTHAAADVSEVR